MKLIINLFIVLFCGFFTVVSYADHVDFASIIIDDLGNSWHYGNMVVTMPDRLTCAFLPYRPYTQELARKAHIYGKEVMLHAPMEAISGLPLGKGGLKKSMTKEQLTSTLINDFDNIPYARGFNNHMGSLLTQQTNDMSWIMQTMRAFPIYFIDSRTTANSVAELAAINNQIPTSHRNIFLDDKRDTKDISVQFARAIRYAKKYGSVIIIAHPYAVTLQFLQTHLFELTDHNIKLIPISQMVDYRIYQQTKNYNQDQA